VTRGGCGGLDCHRTRDNARHVMRPSSTVAAP
jgi:hypothetical protein